MIESKHPLGKHQQLIYVANTKAALKVISQKKQKKQELSVCYKLSDLPNTALYLGEGEYSHFYTSCQCLPITSRVSAHSMLHFFLFTAL